MQRCCSAAQSLSQQPAYLRGQAAALKPRAYCQGVSGPSRSASEASPLPLIGAFSSLSQPVEQNRTEQSTGLSQQAKAL